MKVKISPAIFQQIPGLDYVLILIKNVANLRKVSNLSQLLRGSAVVLKNDSKKAQKRADLERITEVNFPDESTLLESYNFLSKLKKIQSGKEIEGSNNIANFVNYFSFKYALPVFGFDLDQAETDYLIEPYYPKKGKKTPDLDFLPETMHFVFWFPNLLGLPEEELDKIIADINFNADKYLHTQIAEVYHMSSEHPEVDLGYVSDKEAAYQAAPHPRTEEEEETQPQAAKEDIFTAPLDSSAPEKPADKLKTILTSIIKELYTGNESLVEIEWPREAAHGDYSSNIAMKLAKPLSRPPLEIAEEIHAAALKNPEMQAQVEKIEILKPGFINFFLKIDFFAGNLRHILEAGDSYGRQNVGQGHKIMIEYGSLNIAKPTGVHHMPTTIIGQTLVNLHRIIGFEVLAADHPGNWGTQFGREIYAFKKWGDKATVEADPMNELLKLYVKFHQEEEKDSTLEDAARAEFLKLEQGDLENKALWQWMTDISMRDMGMIYQTLGVKHDRVYGEAKYNDVLASLLERGKSLGVFTEGEKGSFIVNLDEEKLPPALVQKSDGASLYLTRDIASVEDRLKSDPGLEELIYVVDSAQILHFKQLNAITGKLHQADPNFPYRPIKHVAFGRMNFGDMGMSTRKGNIIQARALIQEGIRRAEAVLQDKLKDHQDKFTEMEIKTLTKGLAISAIKYSFVVQDPSSEMVFDWDKTLSFDGNSAPYLEYTLTRAFSVLRKAIETPAFATKDLPLDRYSAILFTGTPVMPDGAKPGKAPATTEKGTASSDEAGSNNIAGSNASLGSNSPHGSNSNPVVSDLQSEPSTTRPGQPTNLAHPHKSTLTGVLHSAMSMVKGNNKSRVSEAQTDMFTLDEEKAAILEAEKQAAAEADLTPFSLPPEQILLKKLSQFPDKITAAALSYKPNHLTTYLYELAQEFNSFYASVPILKTVTPDLLQSRLALVAGTAQVLKSGLTILGLTVFERM